MKVEYIKCHGSGNDFILVDEFNRGFKMPESERIDFVVKACSRKGPIGADGVLFIRESSSCDARMQIINSDGSEAEMCGNGLRCVGRYVMEVLNKEIVEIETMKAKYTVKKADDIFNGVKTVEICIDTVSFDVKNLPLNFPGNTLLFDTIHQLSDSLVFTAVSITNPHIISIVDKIDENQLIDIGKKANTNTDVFPRGVNVSFVKILDAGSIYVKTYERGVGLTKSCGTGMTASSVVTCLYDEKRLDSVINIVNDGGMIKCVVTRDKDENYSVRFIGNATFVYKSSIDTEFLGSGDYKPYCEMFNDEINQYDKLLEFVSSSILDIARA